MRAKILSYPMSELGPGVHAQQDEPTTDDRSDQTVVLLATNFRRQAFSDEKTPCGQ